MATRNCQGRKLHWKICLSEQVADLPDPWAKLLFTWLIPTADNLGRMEAEPYQVKGLIFPYEDEMTPERIGELLQMLHDAGLIIWYRAHRLRYLQLPRFAAYQRLVGHMRADSDYPAPSPQCIQAWEAGMNAVYTECEQRSYTVSTEGEGEGEGEGEETPPPSGDGLVDFAMRTLPASESTAADYARVFSRFEPSMPRSQIKRIVCELAEWKPKQPRPNLHLTLNKWLAKEKPEPPDTYESQFYYPVIPESER